MLADKRERTRGRAEGPRYDRVPPLDPIFDGSRPDIRTSKEVTLWSDGVRRRSLAQAASLGRADGAGGGKTTEDNRPDL